MKFTDQMGRSVELPDIPKRIVSLVPSQTELLHDLGLNKEVVGITKFCIHPAHWRKEKVIVGGTKQVHFNRIEELSPDLIIGNKEENEEGFINELATRYPVWMSDIASLNEALDMMEAIGQLIGREKEAEALVVDVLSAFAPLQEQSLKKRRAVYLIWKDPYMAAGKNTFVDEMLSMAGFENLVKETRYPELRLEDIKVLDPEVILLSSEPYPFQEKHMSEIRNELPGVEMRLVDGEMFSWYGSRLLKAPAYFQAL
ncbi:helical backbone metal receptor [Roseivirga sp. UBA838]|uniref:helical backbone metal receptor n=1 Tax=Roseivirga sp. UBA838 TaxID=1947393 RepID=UPI00257EE5B1|nr:helical backbone metal receptor [Roseivirga sp. UBA838]|tara:strand:+ start:19192 stop:19959 length:768 start_codon:yes stop_codon:yes gene_type:complete